MALESESHSTTRALNNVYSTALALGAAGTRETADMAEVFTQLDNVTSARRNSAPSRDRPRSGRCVGRAVRRRLLTVAFTLFFGSENLPAQISMTGVLSVLVTLGLVVIVSIDHPFTGPVRVRPDPLEAVLVDLG